MEIPYKNLIEQDNNLYLSEYFELNTFNKTSQDYNITVKSFEKYTDSWVLLANMEIVVGLSEPKELNVHSLPEDDENITQLMKRTIEDN